jgi:hypothetical protein
MVFALLVPAAVYGARVGSLTASESVERREKIVGCGIVVGCNLVEVLAPLREEGPAQGAARGVSPARRAHGRRGANRLGARVNP